MESSTKDVETKRNVVFNAFFLKTIAGSSVRIDKTRKIESSSKKENALLVNLAQNEPRSYSSRCLENSRIHKDDSYKSVGENNSDYKNQSSFQNLKKESQPEIKATNRRKQSYADKNHSHFEANFHNQNEDYKKKQFFDQTQIKHTSSSNNYILNKNKSYKNVGKHNSHFQDLRFDTKPQSGKIQSNTERKNSHCELDADNKVKESDDYVEFSEPKHQRVISDVTDSSYSFKVSFKNDSLSDYISSSPPLNYSAPPTMPPILNLPPILPVSSLSTESSVSSLPAKSSHFNQPIESVVPNQPTKLASSLPIKSSAFSQPIESFVPNQPTKLASNLPIKSSAFSQPIESFVPKQPTKFTSSLPTKSSAFGPPIESFVPNQPTEFTSSLPAESSVFRQPIESFVPNQPTEFSSSLHSQLSFSNLATESPSRLHIESSVSAVSSISRLHATSLSLSNVLDDYNKASLFLPTEEEYFIPAPVIPSPPSVNSFDSATTCLEKNRTFSSHNNLDSARESSPDRYETEIPVLDPEHIEEISNYISKVVEERKVSSSSAVKVVRELNLLFKDYFEGNKIEVYGSYESELAITTSDINLVVFADISIKKSFMHEVYKVLSSELERYHVLPFEEGITVHKTKVNFSHPDTGVSCQLAYLGKKQQNIVKMGRFLKQMSMSDKRVKTLIIATKIWAEYLAINEIEDGKLHPVGYALLVIHFFQRCKNPILPLVQEPIEDVNVDENTLSVGELWLAFLRYYSIIFNWKQHVVTVNSRENISKKSKQWENYWMAIEDPFTEKNIAESVVNSDMAEYIKSCFKSTYAYFCNPPEIISVSPSNDSGESSGSKYEFSFQQCVLEQSESFCETCEEIDDVCDDCKKKIYVQPMNSVPKMTDSFLAVVQKALMIVYNKYVLTEEEINERKQFVKKLERDVCRVYADAELNLFGSSTNGFGFKNSDLDICISFKTKQTNSVGVLRQIRFLLKKNKSFKHVVGIFGAQIPIIKFFYEPTGWRGDISLDNTLAVHNSELLYTYSLIDKRCKILGCVLKLLTKKALVSEVTEEALSSYSYLNMVIHFLQQVEPPVLPFLQENKLRGNNFRLDHMVENCNVWFCKDLEYIKKVFKCENVKPVEQLWLDLLDYYCSFDSNQFISIRQKETQYITGLQHSARLFNIQDPFIETKNLGRVVSIKKAQETKSVFNRARCLFRTPVKEFPSGVKDIEDYFFSTMSLTGRIHKEAHCDLCGKFGHEQKECKQSCFPLRRPNFRRFQKYNSYNKKSYYQQKSIGQL